MRSFPHQQLTVIVRERPFEEYFESMLQINRYVEGDAWVIGEMLEALHACATTAIRRNDSSRAGTIHAVAATIGEQGLRKVSNDRDRARIRVLMSGFDAESAVRCHPRG